MNIEEKEKIKEILIRENYVSPEDIKRAGELVKIRGGDIIDYLLAEEIITKDLVGQALAESYGIIYADLNSNVPTREQVLKIPEEIATRYRLVLFRESSDKIFLTTDSLKTSISEADITVLRNIFQGKTIEINYSLSEDIDAVFINYRKALDTRFQKIISGSERIAPEIIDEIIADALAFHASDIHFDLQEDEVVIRFRIDGILYEAGRLPKQYYENILNRIKVQSHMRTDEHFSAQDGTIHYQKNGQTVDMRVSVAPTLDGEKIVIRLLAEYIRSLTLSNLGMSKKQQAGIQEVSRRPFGMILTVGPTGSGKTTTLYSILKLLNKPEVNISTIEDPVEYKILGVNHIQVNPQTNLTFSQGLRSIVRQDPDIILVGEIRDKETAEIAINAAMTGHLLLSTFHANDAATAIPRLIDMGIEPFLISSTLQVIIAQRLVRRICEKCRYSTQLSKVDLFKILPQGNLFFPQEEITLYRGKGCSVCSHTGYKGRIAVFEFIYIGKEIQELIMKNPSSNEIWDIAKKQRAEPLFFDGIEKVKSGITTLEELMRVVAPPD